MQATADCREELAACLRAGRWDDAIRLYGKELGQAEKADPASRLHFAIALIRSGKVASGLSRLHEIETLGAEGRDLLRRHVISSLVREQRFDDAVALVDRLEAEDAATPEDLRLRASLHGRQRRYDPAIRDVRLILELEPSDRSARLSLLKLLLQAGRNDEAAEFARSLSSEAAQHPELAGLALLAIERGGDPADALAWAEALEAAGIEDADSAAPAVRAWLAAGRLDRAVEAGEGFIERGIDSGELRRHLATALLASQDQDRARLERAAELLEQPVGDPAADAGLLVTRAGALMRLGRDEEAVPLLVRALALQPHAAGLRALHAKALRQAGRYAEAAREYRRLLPTHPESHNFHRYAAGALSLAGRPGDAQRVFGDFVAARATVLAEDFEAGLDALWDKADQVSLPQERLDWAWSLRSDQGADRAEWERRAKWGHLADHYILDWLECRDDRIGDAMARLADLEPAERALDGIDRSRGVVLASAHIGPMYTGPLALELLGIDARWLASTPSCVQTSYGRRLISTSDQTGAEVARQTLKTLGEGKAAVIAIDGAIALSAPRVAFAGQHITLSSFASRMAHRLGIPSLFVAPRWEEGRIGFTIEPLPDALPDEGADTFAARWQEAFLASLRRYLGGEPENLRLSGGIWRHLVPLQQLVGDSSRTA
jgi:tetratricopeptide (TPR) repeat protein